MPTSCKPATLLISLLVLVGFASNSPPLAAAGAPFWPRFHGRNGDSISSETGLPKQWPEHGPQLLWTAQGIGHGFAGVTIADDWIYTAGDIGEFNVITAMDLGGRIQWQVNNGAAWTASGPEGARGTPTIDGGRLYHENAHDEVVCLDVKTGQPIWSLNMGLEFHGQRGGYGRAESLLIDGDHVILRPGGTTAMAALNKKTGRTVWKSSSAGEPAGYASPIVVEYQGLRMILTMSQKSLIGVNADNGDLLWRFEHYTPRYVANCVTPIYQDGHIFISGGYGKGSALLEITVDAQKATVEPVWRTKDLDNRQGGVVFLNGYVYGASHSSNSAKWVCLDWKTGQMMYAERGVGRGSLVYADGMLYILSERRAVGLVEATPTGHALVSQFKIPAGGDGPTWAHPVVCGGRLYIRHGDHLYAYSLPLDAR